MSNILKIELDSKHQICMKLEFNVFVEKGFEIREWIENKLTRKHVALDDLAGKDFINQRLKMNYASKSLKGTVHLMKINQLME